MSGTEGRHKKSPYPEAVGDTDYGEEEVGGRYLFARRSTQKLLADCKNLKRKKEARIAEKRRSWYRTTFWRQEQRMRQNPEYFGISRSRPGRLIILKRRGGEGCLSFGKVGYGTGGSLEPEIRVAEPWLRGHFLLGVYRNREKSVGEVGTL